MLSFKDLTNRNSSEENGPTDPVSIFYTLERSSDSQIRDLFPIQKEALVEWLKMSDQNITSNLISMDTGIGKTLVGLLIAESMRRRTGGKILYVCPNNNLIEQTALKAKEYGIPVSVYHSQSWVAEEAFLANKQICIVNYHALYFQNSYFKDKEIKGVVYDDAHLSIEIIDKQYTLSIKRSDNKTEYDKILGLLEATELKDTIRSTTQGNDGGSHLVPLHIWKLLNEQIRHILQEGAYPGTSHQWGYVNNCFEKALCFISNSQVDISLLYPQTQKHYLYGSNVQKVFLSATVPNRGDLVRVFSEDIHRMNLDAKDYRPERLFVFSKLIMPSEGSVDFERNSIATIVEKTLILTPSTKIQKLYSEIDYATVVSDTNQINKALEDFKIEEKGILVLANRYDGIDLPDSVCRCSIVDGLPFVGSLKYRFFSEYFRNHNQSFLRTLVASKLIQAFGRTVRGHNDYSVIFILDLALNRWLLDKDNQKFLRDDIIDDLELGIQFSSNITDTPVLKSLVKQMINQDPTWKAYVKENRKVKEGGGQIDLEKEEEDIQLAKIERKIIETYHQGMSDKTISLIEEHQEAIGKYSQPLLGLYLSMASICAELQSDSGLAGHYSSRAFGIRSIFGKPPIFEGVTLNNQTQRIWDLGSLPQSFIWEEKENNFGQIIEEDFKLLGKYLGFEATRPEKDKDGTLDVLWVNHEEKIAIGFELKCDKENRVLNKTDIGQCHDHLQWINDKHPNYERTLYVVGELEAYNKVASPGDLRWCNLNEVREVTSKLRSAYALKATTPLTLDYFLKQNELLPKYIYKKSLVVNLESRIMS